MELVKVKMERQRNEGSYLNRFPPSNFIGLVHFLLGSFIEEQPVGVRTQINREKNSLKSSLASTHANPRSVSPSLSPPVKTFE